MADSYGNWLSFWRALDSDGATRRSVPIARAQDMSEQGWQEFLGADDVEDWVVLHGGAATVFRTETLAEAAGLAGAIARFPASRVRGRC